MLQSENLSGISDRSLAFFALAAARGLFLESWLRTFLRVLLLYFLQGRYGKFDHALGEGLALGFLGQVEEATMVLRTKLSQFFAIGTFLLLSDSE